MLEQLLFPVLILLVLLMSSVLVELLKRQQRMASPEREPEVPIVRPKAPLQPSPPTATPPTPHAGSRGASRPEASPGVIRQRTHSRVGSLREVRRGIVLMTIIGPCRALEPPRPP